MHARQLNEKMLAAHLETLLDTQSLRLVDREVRIGAYRLDAVAIDQRGHLVVVELKVNASMATLGQLLLYPHALRNQLAGTLRTRHESVCGIQLPPIRSMLITTHLDSNVAALAERRLGDTDISIFVCVGDTENQLMLVAPGEVGENQVWDQSARGATKLDTILGHLGATSRKAQTS